MQSIVEEMRGSSEVLLQHAAIACIPLVGGKDDDIGQPPRPVRYDDQDDDDQHQEHEEEEEDASWGGKRNGGQSS